MILLPIPKKETRREGTLFLSMDSMILLAPSCPKDAFVYARMLKEEILKWAGLDLSVGKGTEREGDLSLQVDSSLEENTYRLVIGETGARLSGGSLNSLGWAVQTLRQIVRQCAGALPCLEIEDWPEILNRGFYHDVTRGRVQTLEHLKELADTLAFYKMNQLQLYVEHTYLFRGMTELWRDETPLTAEEILELDDYCFERGIELVPSLSTFGHLYKLLGSRSYEEFCELPDSTGKPFSFKDRMDHHTVNVSNGAAMELIEGMIEEYMQLFRSQKFNLCADETFDLGKGKSKALAAEKGEGTLYVDYILELFRFLIQHGKTPMFWGDVICRHPELFSRLPEGVVCLNWGYSPTQSDTETKILHQVGATQYVCPGACGWNTWINILTNSYRNVRLMCDYARKYDAVGVLNTDWGDFGHINHPIFSIPGLIYGAVFSWGGQVPDYEELNRRIAVLEFGDSSGRLLNLLGQVTDEMRYSWHHAVIIKEWVQQNKPREEIEKFFREEDMGKAAASELVLDAVEKELPLVIRSMDSSCRGIMAHAQVGIRMIRIWNQVGQYLDALGRTKKGPVGQERAVGKEGSAGQEKAAGKEGLDGFALAARLETNLHDYQKLWRSNSKEGDLARITDVFCWYADLLRETSK